MLSNSRARWWGLVVISLGVSLIIVDTTIVNVAVPSIIDDIGITSTQAQWVQEIYTLVFAALLLVFGRLADSFGRRRLFAIGAAVFGVSSVYSTTSPTSTTSVRCPTTTRWPSGGRWRPSCRPTRRSWASSTRAAWGCTTRSSTTSW